MSYELRWFLRMAMAKSHEVLCKIISVKTLKSIHTRLYAKRKIDLNKPKKLNEKILWIEYETNGEERARLTDKFAVREYVTQKGYDDTLVPIYGVYNSGDDVNFANLPDSFVLKATHGCDMNYICSSRDRLNVEEAKARMRFWMKSSLAYMSLEMHYSLIRPRILCEKYLNDFGGVIDYKLFCYNGKAQFIQVISNRYSGGPYYCWYDLNWEPNTKPVYVGVKLHPTGVDKPKQLDRMIQMANDLSSGFPFVRVDLYEIKGKLYFGEMTFTPATGVLSHFTETFLIEEGKKLDISGLQKKY